MFTVTITLAMALPLVMPLSHYECGRPVSGFLRLATISLILVTMGAKTAAVFESDPADLKTLKYVQVIMRHGDRNPIGDYPNNPYKDMDRDWPGGFGQLTHTGEEQACELGAYLRDRYDGFLPAVYHVDQFSAWSSHTDRSIRSGVAALRGLFPRPISALVQHSTPTESPTENKYTHESDEVTGHDVVEEKPVLLDDKKRQQDECLSWESQVVPMRTVPKEVDNFIYYGQKCDRFKKEYSRFLAEDPEIQEILNDGKDFFKTVINETRVDLLFGGVEDRLRVGLVFDSIFVQQSQKKILPAWFTPEMDSWAQKWFSYTFAGESGTPLLRRLRSGILQKVLQNMENFVNDTKAVDLKSHSVGSKNVGPSSEFKLLSAGKTRPSRMVLFSGHDTTLVAFLNILQIYNHIRAPYSAAVLIELHQHPENEEYTVEIFFRNDTTTKAYPLRIPACAAEGPCFLSQFKEISELIFPQDFYAECQLISGDGLLLKSRENECSCPSLSSTLVPQRLLQLLLLPLPLALTTPISFPYALALPLLLLRYVSISLRF